MQKFLLDEGAVAWIESNRGDDGTVFVQQGGSRDPKDPPAITRVALATEHYGRIYRLLQKKIPVTLKVDVDNKFYDEDLNSFDILGEIPGTDKADEVVMLGGHFDSWQAGNGRDRQRSGRGDDAGSDPHFEGHGTADAPDGAGRAVDGRGRRVAGFARVREGAFRPIPRR